MKEDSNNTGFGVDTIHDISIGGDPFSFGFTQDEMSGGGPDPNRMKEELQKQCRDLYWGCGMDLTSEEFEGFYKGKIDTDNKRECISQWSAFGPPHRLSTEQFSHTNYPADTTVSELVEHERKFTSDKRKNALNTFAEKRKILLDLYHETFNDIYETMGDRILAQTEIIKDLKALHYSEQLSKTRPPSTGEMITSILNGSDHLDLSGGSLTTVTPFSMDKLLSDRKPANEEVEIPQTGLSAHVTYVVPSLLDPTNYFASPPRTTITALDTAIAPILKESSTPLPATQPTLQKPKRKSRWWRRSKKNKNLDKK